MERKRNWSSGAVLIGVLLGVAAFGVALQATAITPFSVADIGGSVGLGTADLRNVVFNVIRWVLGILALVAVSYIIYGGFIWLTAAGNPERIQKAKRIIINAVIGLVIVLLAFAIVSFVVRAIQGSSGDDGDGTPITCPPICPPPDVGLEIRSITTDCGNPPDFRHDVFLCSAVNVVFNHLLNGSSVKSAVEASPPAVKLKIEKCLDDDSDPCDSVEDPPSGPIANQVFTDATPSRTQAEWVARLDPNNPGKNLTFFHVQQNFEADTWYRMTIPKTIGDVQGNTLSGCRENLADLDGIDDCQNKGTHYEWRFQTGTRVDTTAPRVSTAYPDIRYLTQPAFDPDRNVVRTPIISIRYDQAVLPPTQVELIAFDANAPPDPATGLGGTLGAAVNPANYTVVPTDDGRGAVIQVKSTTPLDRFTWYKAKVAGVNDLCSNAQDPEPFEWVFETNDVVPGIADHYPRNNTADACEDTPVFIRYTVSMYDSLTSSCSVSAAGNGGYVTAGYMSPNPATGTKTFNVQDPCPGGCLNPQNYCKVYAFMPPPPFPPDSVLSVNQTYRIGVDNRFVINDSGDTLRFGEGLPPGPPSRGQWHFDVKPAGQCANRPVITSVQPPQGTDGQCVTVRGFNFDQQPGYGSSDELLYAGTPLVRMGQPNEQVLGWTDTAIPAEVPAGATGAFPFKVKTELPPPFGVLDSNDFPWDKIAGPASTGPCLAALNPNAGFAGSGVTATGVRFDQNSNLKDILFNAIASTWTRWEDRRVDTTVPNLNPSVVDVTVQNDQGTSNPLPYTINPIPPDQPIVVDRWPSCSTSCVNADVGARFSVDVDVASLTAPGTVILRQCNDQDCSSFSGGPITVSVVYDGPPDFKAHFQLSVTLVPDKWYRVILKDTIKGSTAPADSTLGGLNYDEDGNGSPDAFSWTFKTQSGAGGCRFDRVVANPRTATMRQAGETKPYYAEGYTEPNSCSATGQLLNPQSLNWAWSSNPAYATVQPVVKPWNAVVTAVAETVPGTTDIKATGTDTLSVSKVGTGVLTIDFSFCEDDTDCEAGGLCTGSTCDQATRRCSPLLKSLSRTNGAIGTWLGVAGCYFGNYARGTCQGGSNAGAACDVNPDCDSQNCAGGSAVIYTNNQRGRWPNPPLCGAPATQWSSTNITSEVPDRDAADLSASDGPIVVQRWDGKRSNRSLDFTVDPAVIVPGICRVTPGSGSDGTTVTISGQNFEDNQGTGRATFYKEKDVATYDSWTASQIVGRAPNGIENNTDDLYSFEGVPWQRNEVGVKQNGQWSKIANFNVTPPGCQVCANDNQCSVGSGCGYNGCCAIMPTVTGVDPTDGRTNVCRNVVVAATFDRDLDSSTVNTGSVHLQQWGRVAIPGGFGFGFAEVAGITVRYDAAARRVSITPPSLLNRNNRYQVVLSRGGIIRSRDGAPLAEYSWEFTTADSEGPCAVSRIEVLPPTWIFPKATPGDPDASQLFTARALSDANLEITEVPNVYDWDWDWEFADGGTIAHFIPDPPNDPGDSDAATVEAKPVKGQTRVIVRAKPTNPARGLTREVAGSATITVTACENPWVFRDSNANCTIVNPGASCTDFHFDLNYCLDGGLPNLSFDGSSIRPTVTEYASSGTTSGPALLKEFLFKELNAETRDAVGIRIYDNTEGLSAAEWYKKYAPQPGQTATLSVDGYDAVRDGTTVYVAASDFDGGRFNPKIYLISYNQGADQKMVSIYNQMLDSWFFNNNPQLGAICNVNNDNDKLCAQRDLKRVAAISDVVQYLRGYRTDHGFYPKLEAGSFLPQLSFSVWPSWQQTLGGDLKQTLPIDPKNEIVNCPSGQSIDGACWNETQKKFICPSGSRILGYQGTKDGTTARLYANLEYTGTGAWINNPSETVCAAPSSCQCFNYAFGP
ncbi:MAG: Ig-like domain-containing protein [Candidatus Kerfeldbacteria bacterium]|nr:Ig-like domain-containing protein [Candidatus Kerfeldbacteria bacterium]